MHHPKCFIQFDSPINDIKLPERFNFPFNYQPHELCKVAASQLQQYLLTQTEWVHDFGIDNYVDGTNIGKMFGVMVVRASNGQIGFLAAFSGKLAGKNNLWKFVPPIVDLLDENGFYRQGEDKISAVNQQIAKLEMLPEYRQAESNWKEAKQQAELEITNFRQAMKAAKKHRDHQRALAESQLSAQGVTELKETLKSQSLKWQYDFKLLQQDWGNKLRQYQQELSVYTNEIEKLKLWRKEQSARLQQKLFDHYQFINGHGETKGVCDIFSQTELKVPPAGAGDCAAPKLLQYAYQNNLTPLSMVEFWWGQTPKSEIRQHGKFYPSCRSKCEPILGHMLIGLDVDPNPILRQKPQLPEILFEDEWIGVLDKPAEFLSVPGKTSAPSVYTFLKEKYPTATGPLIVHRLDMSTSGLMVFAKDMESYHHLQSQFLHHNIKKKICGTAKRLCH